MSTQSAALRTTAPAGVGRQVAPVTLTDEVPQEDTRVSVWWIPALMIGAWVELAYVVPVLADWFARIS